MTEDKHKHTKRDAETLTLLGIFLITLSIPVMVGTLWAGDKIFYHVVNMAAGLVIAGVGAGLLWRGRRYAKENK